MGSIIQSQSMRNYCTVFESDKMSSVKTDIDLIVLLVDNVILDFVNV